jgi:amino acid transporter
MSAQLYIAITLAVVAVIEIFACAMRWVAKLDKEHTSAEAHPLVDLLPVYAVVFLWLGCVAGPTAFFARYNLYVPALGTVFAIATMAAMFATFRELPTMVQILYACARRR